MNERILFLIDRYLENRALAEEREELFQLVNSGKYDDAIKASIGESLLDTNPATKPEKEEREAIWSAIMEASSKQNRKTPLRHIGFSNRWMWAAASIVIIISATYLFLQNKNALQQVPAIASNKLATPILPGHQGAILTLSNGNKIVLDSMKNGVVATQNGAKIMLVDGQLSYNPNSGPTEMVYNTMSTPKGRVFTIQLSDGTQVWLNASSSITYPIVFTGSKREVEITGEAYFEVAHHASKPFIVKRNDMEIKVLGTHFNVNAYADEEDIKVTLLEGAVRVSNGSGDIKIEPGQQVKVGKTSLSLNKDINLAAVMAWKNGEFFFDRASIKTVMRQIQRWYNVEVVYQGKVTRHFGGTIPRNVDASKVFEMLEMTGGVNFKIVGEKVVVMP